MKTRTIAILIGCIGLLALVAVLADRSERAHHSPQVAGRMLPGFEPAKAVKIEIKTKDKTALLEKKDGAWMVSPEGFTADEPAVLEALEKLETMEKAELAAENPEKHAALEVKEGDDKGIVVKVWTAPAGDPAVHLFIGKAGGDFKSSFVRLNGEKNVYRTREMVRTVLDRPRGWRDRTIVKFPADDVVRLELTSEAGHWVLERPAEPKGAPWAWVEPEPGPAIEHSVDGIIQALANFQADEFPTSTDPVACGTAEPKARTKVVLRDGRTFELQWGGEAPQNRIFIKRSDQPSIWEVMSYKKTQVFPAITTLKPVPSPAPAQGQVPAPEPAPATN